MDVKCFRDWWFSWASHQEIDFRQQCFSCGSSPKILACDGTKIGPRATLIKLDPVERIQGEDTHETTTRKLNRCFISSPYDHSESKKCRDARIHLRYICDLVQNKVKEKDLLPDLQKKANDMLLLSLLPKESIDLFLRFSETSLMPTLLNPTVELFRYLSREAPLRSLIPLEILPDLNELCIASDECKYIDVSSALARTRKQSPVISTFIRASFSEDFLSADADCISLLKYLIRRVEIYKSTIVTEVDSMPIEGSYNPPRFGRAYYFRTDGKQI